MTPRIAIPTPTTKDRRYNDRSWQPFADCIQRAGGEAVRLPLDPPRSAQLALAASCQGVCLPGSPADVDPAGYGQKRERGTARADAPREAADVLLLEEALAHGKPVLAVCFGLQALNVWRGGTLVQDLSPLPVHHGAGDKVAIAHSALVVADSLLGQLLLDAPATRAEAPENSHPQGFLRLPINTSHHQAVGQPGQGLRIVARCPDDGVVEAVEWDTTQPHKSQAPALRLLGVQWHPERSYDISAASRALFTWLVREAATGHEARTVPEAAAAFSR